MPYDLNFLYSLTLRMMIHAQSQLLIVLPGIDSYEYPKQKYMNGNQNKATNAAKAASQMRFAILAPRLTRYRWLECRPAVCHLDGEEAMLVVLQLLDPLREYFEAAVVAVVVR